MSQPMRALLLRNVNTADNLTVLAFESNDGRRTLTVKLESADIGGVRIERGSALYNGKPVHISTAWAILGQDSVYAG